MAGRVQATYYKSFDRRTGRTGAVAEFSRDSSSRLRLRLELLVALAELGELLAHLAHISLGLGELLALVGGVVVVVVAAVLGAAAAVAGHGAAARHGVGLRHDLGVLEGPQLGQHEGKDGDGRDEEDPEGAEVGDDQHVGTAH